MLSEQEYEVRLSELQKVRIVLDENPVAGGLLSISQKIAQVQGHKDRVSALFVEAINNRSQAQIMLNEAKADYDQKLHNLLATDEDVQRQKNMAAQKAMADTKISQEVLQAHWAEKAFEESDAYYKCVQHIYSNLESANSNLSRQISVVQMAIDMKEIERGDMDNLFPKVIIK
jgi:hypothetical protein